MTGPQLLAELLEPELHMWLTSNTKQYGVNTLYAW